MRIQNLGPISDATVHLNNLTLFIGDNDTGKTLAAYSVFAFHNWLEQFVPDLFSMEDFNGLRMSAKIQINIQRLQDSLRQKLVEAFNALNEEGQYFQDFFRDESTYKSGVTKITIDNQDLNLFGLRMDEARLAYATVIQDGQSKRQNYALTFEAVDGDLRISKDEIVERREISSSEQVLVRLNRMLEGFFVDSLTSSVYLPAERMGINVLQSRLNNQIVAESFANPLAVRSSVERYPCPIEAYIKYLNGALNLAGRPYDEKESVEEIRLLRKLVPGTFSFDEMTNRIKYQASSDNSKQIDVSLVSSSLKSLLGIELFFKNRDIYNWLIIEEPEMGLHPTKQTVMMDLLYQFTVADGHVVIATHSDYLVKELINQVLASKLTDSYKHVEMADKVVVYEFSESGVRNLGDISSQNQAGLANFDRTTDEINNRYYDLLEKMDSNSEGLSHY
ncbi:AAA family ATPase [Levilactobacillus wangkuiensis]|uniref:AAA family ATPase n=1 Tax=Levilactobacillus wangkuiensis TaxID=2799566 RepID=UPI001941C10F|nr:AAA family ATPase [Levilactobacillus wangkuiensis]